MVAVELRTGGTRATPRSMEVSFQVLLYSVLVFTVIPLAAGVLLRRWLIAQGNGRSGTFSVVLSAWKAKIGARVVRRPFRHR